MRLRPHSANELEISFQPAITSSSQAFELSFIYSNLNSAIPLYILLNNESYSKAFFKQNQPLTQTKRSPMTIRLPPDNILDRILAIFGKHRKIILPKTNLNQSIQTPYITITAKKENFFKALLRTNHK